MNVYSLISEGRYPGSETQSQADGYYSKLNAIKGIELEAGLLRRLDISSAGLDAARAGTGSGHLRIAWTGIGAVTVASALL
eukprot:424227-Pleurochrysis_carterae.AAC.1